MDSGEEPHWGIATDPIEIGGEPPSWTLMMPEGGCGLSRTSEPLQLPLS